MTKPRFFITDVFTTERYGGNPLATFADCDSLSDRDMQAIAREINFSETTFITSMQPGRDGFAVRIFTPTAEVPFAGHPVLGTAHVIRHQLCLSKTDEIVLGLGAGPVRVTFAAADTGTAVLWMQQPTPVFGDTYQPGTLAGILGIDDTDFTPGWPIQEVSTGFPHIIVPLKDLNTLKRVVVDRQACLDLVDNAWAKLVLVFCTEGYNPGQGLGVRVFADYYGIAEDAATGSGNGCLAAYLLHHGLLGPGPVDIVAGQGYEMGRPSTLALRAQAAGGTINIGVGGCVVDVAQGIWG